MNNIGENPALQKVSGPAIGLIVTGIIDLILAVVFFISQIINVMTTDPAKAQIKAQDQAAFQTGFVLGGILGVVWYLIMMLAAVVIMMGALKMKKLESFGFAMTATILAMIPCTSCCFPLGIGMGIWALMVLNSAEVKSAFH